MWYCPPVTWYHLRIFMDYCLFSTLQFPMEYTQTRKKSFGLVQMFRKYIGYRMTTFDPMQALPIRKFGMSIISCHVEGTGLYHIIFLQVRIQSLVPGRNILQGVLIHPISLVYSEVLEKTIPPNISDWRFELAPCLAGTGSYCLC